MQDLMMCYSEMKPCSFNTSAAHLRRSINPPVPTTPSKQRTTALDGGHVCDLGFLPAIQELPGQKQASARNKHGIEQCCSHASARLGLLGIGGGQNWDPSMPLAAVYFLHTWKECRFGQRHGLQNLTLISYFYKNIYRKVIYLYFYESIFQDKSIHIIFVFRNSIT